MLAASVYFGFAVAVSAWLILSVVFAKRTNRGVNHRFEVERRQEIRDKNPLYRYFEPSIDEIAASIESKDMFKHEEFAEYLSASAEPLPWKASEYLATKIIESAMFGLVALAFLRILSYSWLVGILIATLIGCGLFLLAQANVKKKAQKRRQRIKRHFAAAIDLLALMMEVGGSFQESLRIATRENVGHALGDELALIVNDIEMGKPRKHALESFASRMSDEDISEVVFACNESEELGVPIAETLKTQADRIREKRTSWAEKAAQEAEVTLVFPSMLIMLACLGTVSAPFILQGLSMFRGGI
jgi:tight adherence protein C